MKRPGYSIDTYIEPTPQAFDKMNADRNAKRTFDTRFEPTQAGCAAVQQPTAPATARTSIRPNQKETM